MAVRQKKERRMPIPGCGDGHCSLVVDHVVCDDGLTAAVLHQRGHGYKSRVLDLYHDEIVAWLGVCTWWRGCTMPLQGA